MIGSFIPALCGLAMAVLLVTITQRRGRIVTMDDLGEDAAKASKDKDLPSLGRSRVAPITAVVLLLLNPVGSILHIGLLERFQVDAMYILVPGIHPGPAGRGTGRQNPHIHQRRPAAHG